MNDPTLDVPRWLSASAAWAWRLILLVFTVLAGGWLALRVRVVVIPVLVGLMLASVLSPLAQRLVRRKIPALAATWLVLLTVLLVVGLPLFGVGWGLTNQITDNSDQWTAVADDFRTWLNEGPFGLSEEEVASLEERLTDTIVNGHPVWPAYGPGPFEAVNQLLPVHGDFIADTEVERFGLSFNSGGFLRRVR